MAAAGKEHKPLRKAYHRASQIWYDVYNPATPSASEHLEKERWKAFREWQSHDYSSGKFTALLNIYHLLRGHGVCTYHKYKIGGDYYSHNCHVKQWLKSGSIDGFTPDMANLLLESSTAQVS